MKKSKSILLLLLVFLAGVAIGVVGTHIAVGRFVQQAIVHPERAQAMMERNLVHRLRLDNDQQLKLHAILADTRVQLAELRKQIQPQATAILRDTDQKISDMLTPGQKTRYEKIKDKTWPALRRLRGVSPPSQQ